MVPSWGIEWSVFDAAKSGMVEFSLHCYNHIMHCAI